MNTDEEFISLISDTTSVVAEIVKRFGVIAISNIFQAIKSDPITEPDAYGIVSILHSGKWNSLALTYLQNNFLLDHQKAFIGL